jgi:hypothetical protein
MIRSVRWRGFLAADLDGSIAFTEASGFVGDFAFSDLKLASGDHVANCQVPAREHDEIGIEAAGQGAFGS